MKQVIGTVCFIKCDNRVLLAEIQLPDGRIVWNGIGGVVDPGETPMQAVVREISEETKLRVDQSEVVESKIVIIGALELHVFTASSYSGELEIIDPTLKQLKWFDYDEVPYQQMHPGNDTWLPNILNSVEV